MTDLSEPEVAEVARGDWLDREVTRRGRPDVVVAIHALRTGVAAIGCARRLGVRMVLATGGTDVRPGLQDPATARVACEVFTKADVVLVQARNQLDVIAETCGVEVLSRVHHLPTAVARMEPDREGAAAFRRQVGVDQGEALAVLVAGLRPVKGVLEAIEL